MQGAGARGRDFTMVPSASAEQNEANGVHNSHMLGNDGYHFTHRIPSVAGSMQANPPLQSATTCPTFGRVRSQPGRHVRPARPEATHQHTPLGVPCQKPTGESRAVSLIHSPPPSTNQCT
jgi:hypothetical protein